MPELMHTRGAAVPEARVLANAIMAARAATATPSGTLWISGDATPATRASREGIDPASRLATRSTDAHRPDRSEQVDAAVALLLVRYAEVMAGLADA